MAVGLEGRVPLLDDALLQLAERTPERRMMSLRRGKIILRELAERYGAPVSSLKRGFAVPLGEYLSAGGARRHGSGSHSAETDLVDQASALRLLDERVPPASDLWMLATLIAWENRLKSVRSAAGKSRRTSRRRRLAMVNKPKMQALVTGGGGFIGHHLVRRLLADGYDVRVLDNFSTGRRERLEGLEVGLVEGDLRSYERAHTAVRGTDVVFHLGALPSSPGRFRTR